MVTVVVEAAAVVVAAVDAAVLPVVLSAELSAVVLVFWEVVVPSDDELFALPHETRVHTADTSAITAAVSFLLFIFVLLVFVVKACMARYCAAL